MSIRGEVWTLLCKTIPVGDPETMTDEELEELAAKGVEEYKKQSVHLPVPVRKE
jgi:hypothetical protein